MEIILSVNSNTINVQSALQRTKKSLKRIENKTNVLMRSPTETAATHKSLGPSHVMSVSAGSRLHSVSVLSGHRAVALFGPVSRLFLGLQSSVPCVEEDHEAAREQSKHSRHHQHRH